MPNVGVPEFDQLPDDRNCIFAGRRRIAGAVRQEHAIGLERHDVFGRGFCRHDRDLAAGAGEQPKNVALDAIVDGNNMEFRTGLPGKTLAPGPRSFIPGKALSARHHRHKIHADQAGPFRGFLLERGDIEFAIGRVRDHGVRHAVDADQRRQGARIDAGQPDNAARLEPVTEISGCAIVRRRGDRAVQNNPTRAGCCRHVDGFDVLFVGADIADMREGEGDDLPCIGRVGEDLLVARHGGVEAHLADRMTGRTEPEALDYGSVSQYQKRGRLGLGPSARCAGGAGFRLGHGLLVAYYSVRGKGPPGAAPRQI